MPQHHGLVDLCLPEPGTLLPGGEDLHSHVPPAPPAPPHLPEAALADDLLQDDRPRHRPLHKQGQAWGQGTKTINPGLAENLLEPPGAEECPQTQQDARFEEPEQDPKQGMAAAPPLLGQHLHFALKQRISWGELLLHDRSKELQPRYAKDGTR